jgi:hypothetical protein
MTETQARSSTEAASARRRFPSRPPGWLWWVSLPAQAVCALLLTNFSFFWVDDFLLLGQARTQSFGVGYLRESVFGHFSPDLRAIDSMIIAINSGSWVVARIAAIVLYMATIAAAMFVLRGILGRTWTAWAFALVFGQSLFLIRLLGWWTSVTAILPNSLFLLLSFGCALRWFQRRGGWWLAGTLVTFALALCDYELAMVFPAYLLLARLLVMEDDLSPRHLVSVLWDERWLWLGLMILDALTLVNFFAGHYYVKTPSPTVLQDLQFLFDTAIRAFIPAQLGYSHYPAQPGPLALALTLGIFAVGLAATLTLRPRAWRALVALVISFSLAMLPLGLNRIWAVGVTVGQELFYEESAALVFLVFAAFAISRRWGGERSGIRLPGWATGRAPALASVVALAAYGTAYAISARRLGAGTPIAALSKRFVQKYVASADALGARLGHRPAVLDQEVPTTIMPASYEPFSDEAVFFGMFRPRARFDAWSSPLFVISDGGGLDRAQLQTIARARIATAEVIPGPSSEVGISRTRACVHGDVALSLRVGLTPASTHPARTSTTIRALGIRYLAPAGKAVAALVLMHDGGVVQLGTQGLPAGSGGILFPLPANTLPGRLVALQIVLPPATCLTGASLLAVSSG